MIGHWLRTRLLRRRAVRANVSVGRDFSVGVDSLVWAPRSLAIGDRVALGSQVRIEVDGEIGDHVLIANGAGIVGRHDHEIAEVGRSIRDARWVGDDPGLSLVTRIGSDVWIGYRAIVLSGVTIGESAIVGAGAVVVSDIPANSIAVGTPARVVGMRFEPADFEAHWRELSRKGVRRFPRTAGTG